jgi:hypothetical protein
LPRRLVTGGIVVVTILATLPIFAGRWDSVVPYWYNAAPLVFNFLPALLGLLVVTLYLVGSHLLAARSGALVVGWSLVGSVVIPMALLALVGDPLYILFTRTVSSQVTGASHSVQL